jgi:hypothetical protein
VIIPPRRGTQPPSPILISGPYTQAMLLENLEQAVLGEAPAAGTQTAAEEVTQR